jgi:hypothetical protein
MIQCFLFESAENPFWEWVKETRRKKNHGNASSDPHHKYSEKNVIATLFTMLYTQYVA